MFILGKLCSFSKDITVSEAFFSSCPFKASLFVTILGMDWFKEMENCAAEAKNNGSEDWGEACVCLHKTKVIYVNNNAKLVDPNDRIFRIGRTQNNISYSQSMFHLLQNKI